MFKFITKLEISFAGTIFLVISGFILWILEDMNILTPGKHLGSGDWVMGVVFLIGSLICIIFIPNLYIVSYREWKKGEDSWKPKLILIYPSFLFGIFFQFSLDWYPAILTLLLSILAISITHIIIMVIVGKKSVELPFFKHLFLLLVFYLIVIFLHFSFDFFNILEYPIRALLNY